MDIECVNKSFCERILQSHQKNKNIKVIKVSKELATSKGDNFLSEIYRIFIQYTNSKNVNANKNEETSLILKIKLANLSIGADSIDGVFYTESKVFRNILPKIEKYVGCPVAPLFYCDDDNSNYIAMEDLSRLRYAIGDKLKGLTFQECHKVIEVMAKFHAGSVRVAETEPELLQRYDHICPWDIFPQNFFKFMSDSLLTISKSIAEKCKEEEYQEIACKLKKMSNDFETKVKSAFKHREDEFCVLNHGDFWINNVMVQHNEEGQPTDSRMIDFQLVTYTSPAIDLQHFFAMCPELEIKGEKDEYFLEMYLTILTKTMAKIGCKTKPPTKSDLKEAMKTRGVHSVVTGLIFYPRVQADKDDVEDFVDVMSEGETKLDLFKNPLSVNIIRKFSRIINEKDKMLMALGKLQNELSFYERILQSYHKNKNIKVTKVSKELATSKGDNFLSEIYRIFIKYTNNDNDNENTSGETSIIFKIKLDNQSMSKTIDKAFCTETQVFKNILPKIEKYIGCLISPHLYYTDVDSNYIVMEDLVRSGYIVENKLKGLNFEQCHQVIAKMAKFHAGSVIIAETEHQLLQCYDNVCAWEIFPKAFFKFMKDSLIRISENIAKKWKEEEYQRIACKLTKLIADLETRVISAFKYRDGEFCVLNHGDFWINNIMVHYNKKEESTDARMIDFQLVTYTSPAIDLQHFFAMCPELKLKGSKDKYFLEMYLTVLSETMAKIGCKTKPPTMGEIQEAMRRRGIHSVITGLIFYPGIHANNENIEDFVDVMSEGETTVDVFQNPSAVEIIRKFSSIINDKGYLD